MAEPRFEVTGLGELLLRLSVPSGKRLEAATSLDLHPAGAEANVISLLARLERRAGWFGALPNNAVGRLAMGALRIAGADTSGIIWSESGRMGTYYVEFGAPPRGIQVTYDRAHSCAAELRVEDISWKALLDTRLLHLTGITPALSASCSEIVVETIRQAKELGVSVSFDVNYRQKLWHESQAAKALTPLIRSVELLFCSMNDAKRLFHCEGTPQQIAQQMLEASQAHYVVLTVGEQGAWLWDGKAWSHEPSRATQIVDRLGAGDALAAGVIHGWLDGNVTLGLRYGVTLAAMALSQLGDMVITNREELLRLNHDDAALTR